MGQTLSEKSIARLSHGVNDYDKLGQVTSGKRYWSDWTPVAGQQFEYGFDDTRPMRGGNWLHLQYTPIDAVPMDSDARGDISHGVNNRTSTKTGGDSAGGSLRSASYTNNTLNQITGRDVPAYLNVIGAASATATNVNVNNIHAYRKGEYYRVELNPDNTSSAVWQSVTNRVVQNGTTNSFTGNLFLPQHAEAFSYDADGNLTNDGRWKYVWDGENRLVSMSTPTTAPSGSRKSLTFGYDSRGRRISKTVRDWTGSTWVKVIDEKYLYDGWNQLTSLNASNNAVVRAFLWGSDLSGSMQGAGGVGGLLAVKATGSSVTFPAYDGNGNVTALIDAAEGNTFANYDYGPFGEVIRASGTAAKTNPFRFSTKFQDEETDQLYYGYRSYNPSTGKWLNRDPIEELGGMNLIGMIGNDPINAVDSLGLASLDQLARIMNSIHTGLERTTRNCCPNETAYLKCVLDELNKIFEKSGFDQAVQQALSQVDSWKVTIKGATGLDPLYADQLEDALNALSEKGGGKVEKLNDGRLCFNKCIKRVTGPVGEVMEVYNGDAITATMAFFEKASAAGVPLKPLEQWISFYKEAYTKATKAIDQIGLDGLERALNRIENIDMDDCDDMNLTFQREGAPPGIATKCKPALKSGGAY